ncbi:MAG: response regulator transcription factor [Betaproteobacteria bacterium]|nr:response regulator transcription factor [Betaproteobacteria bacterium]
MSDVPAAVQIVHVVDDDEALRDSLAWLLESRGLQVRQYASGEEFLAAPLDEVPGCLVLDVRMPGIGGLELYERLQVRGCALPVIFITGHGDVPMAVTALKKGAADFIEKPFNDQALLHLIQDCLARDRDARVRRLRDHAAAGRLAQLTARERAVLDLVVAGKLNKQVADILGISVKTVEAHRARVMEKMGVRSVAELVQAVIQARGGGQ